MGTVPYGALDHLLDLGVRNHPYLPLSRSNSLHSFVSSYGVFQTYYSGTLNLDPSAISWLGSVQIFLLFFVGTFSGRALDAGLFRPVYIAGSILQLIGIFSLSAATTYWQLFLAQAVCTGLANGLQFCPCMSLLTTYFAKRRNLAVDRKSTRLNSSHSGESRMPSSA